MDFRKLIQGDFMKKIIVVLLIIQIVLSATGCVNGETATLSPIPDETDLLSIASPEATPFVCQVPDIDFSYAAGNIQNTACASNDKFIWLVNNGSLIEIEIDTRTINQIEKEVNFNICLSEEYLYYCKNDTIFRMNCESKESEEVITEEEIVEFISNDKFLYYTVNTQNQSETDTYIFKLIAYDMENGTTTVISEEVYYGIMLLRGMLFYQSPPRANEPIFAQYIQGESEIKLMLFHRTIVFSKSDGETNQILCFYNMSTKKYYDVARFNSIYSLEMHSTEKNIYVVSNTGKYAVISRISFDNDIVNVEEITSLEMRE